MAQVTLTNLIYKEAHRARWTGIDFDDRVGIAALAAVEAQANHNPDRGAVTTLATCYIRNQFKNEVAKHQTRMKYDGVQVSTLLESQIPACEHTPDPERQTIFRDLLAKLGEDAKQVVNLALHTPKCAKGKANVLGAIQQHLCWNNYRFQKACNEIRGILYP